MTPIEHFNQWFNDALKLTKARLPAACCLSTIGLDGFPNARFVSLKEVTAENFIVTGSFTSRKGVEINSNNKVALTFWWPETEKQVRIQGFARKITEPMADKYFAERNRDSQIVSIVSAQGEESDNIETLIRKYEVMETDFLNKPLARPENWGGYAIEPVRIEFLAFKSTRFHDRKLYELTDGAWSVKQLQP